MVDPVFLLLLVFLLLQSLQLSLIHHLLDQVFLPAHSVSQVLGKVGDQVRDQSLDGKDHMLQKHKTLSEIPDLYLHYAKHFEVIRCGNAFLLLREV